MSWTVVSFNEVVEREIEDLPIDIRAKLDRLRLAIEKHGPMSLPRPYSKSLGGGLWELRLSGRDGIARVIYITIVDKKVVLLRAFVKKTQKTPASELKLARNRAKALVL
jgi:phage-related protein